MRHPTVEDAQAHIRRMVRLGAAVSMVFIYPPPPRKCKWCGGWHVGHKLIRRRRRQPG